MDFMRHKHTLPGNGELFYSPNLTFGSAQKFVFHHGLGVQTQSEAFGLPAGSDSPRFGAATRSAFHGAAQRPSLSLVFIISFCSDPPVFASASRCLQGKLTQRFSSTALFSFFLIAERQTLHHMPYQSKAWTHSLMMRSGVVTFDLCWTDLQQEQYQCRNEAHGSGRRPRVQDEAVKPEHSCNIAEVFEGRRLMLACGLVSEEWTLSASFLF